jgi:hypothetical protein
MKKVYYIVIFILALVQLSSFVSALESGDVAFMGVEADKVLNLFSGILAAALCIITYVAYRRTNRNRLIFVSLAFLLFAVKGLMEATEIFAEAGYWLDLTVSALDFGILLSFFYGVLRK